MWGKFGRLWDKMRKLCEKILDWGGMNCWQNGEIMWLNGWMGFIRNYEM